jgi:O-antigen/teichoic acid export membrane protein
VTSPVSNASDADLTADDNLTERVGRGVMWSLVQAWGGRLLSTLVLVVLARLLDPADFGLVALATVFVEFGNLMVDQGLGASLVQRREIDPVHVSTAFWTSMAFSVLAALGLAVLAVPLSSVLGEPSLAEVLVVLALVFPFNAAGSIPIALLQRDLAFASLAVRRLVAASVAGGVGVAMAFAGFGVWALVAQTLLNAAVGSVVVVVAMRFRPAMHWSRSHFRELFGFSSRVFGVETMNFATRRGEDLIVGAVLGPVSLGLYAVATRLQRLVMEVLVSALGSVAFPTFARVIHDLPRARRVYLGAISITSLFAFPAFIGLAALSPHLVVGLFGPQWAESAPLAALASLSGPVLALGFYTRGVLLAAGSAGTELRLAALRLVTRLIAVVGGLVMGGLTGLAVGILIQSYLVAPLGLRSVSLVLDLPMREYLPVLKVPVLGSVVMAGVVVAIGVVLDGVLGDLAISAIAAAAGALTYVGVAALLDRSVVGTVVSLGRNVVGRRATP